MRKYFAKIHLWLSLPLGIVIVIVCLTGAILVFEQEIKESLHPTRYFVEEVKGEPLPPATLMQLAREQLPDSLRLNGLRLSSDPKRTYQLVLPGKKAAGFINPYTGEVTGVDDGKGFFLKTMQIHRWLLSDYKRDGSFSWGKALVGYSTLGLVLILLSGLFLWFPRNRKVLLNRLKIRTKVGGFRFFYDLHVTGGFYATLLLLAMALTGLTWSFGWYRNGLYSLLGVQTESSSHNSSPERKERTQKRREYTAWNRVLAELQERYPAYQSLTLQEGTATVSTARYGNTRGSDRYLFDRQTGEITEVQLYQDQPKAQRIKGWIYSIHVGSWGGIATRIATCLASLLGAAWTLTGYYLWWRKKRRG